MYSNDPLDCIHTGSGLCPSCQAEYDQDPEAYVEFGDHPDGIKRWKEIEQLMEQVCNGKNSDSKNF